MRRLDELLNPLPGFAETIVTPFTRVWYAGRGWPGGKVSGPDAKQECYGYASGKQLLSSFESVSVTLRGLRGCFLSLALVALVLTAQARGWERKPIHRLRPEDHVPDARAGRGSSLGGRGDASGGRGDAAERNWELGRANPCNITVPTPPGQSRMRYEGAPFWRGDLASGCYFGTQA